MIAEIYLLLNYYRWSKDLQDKQAKTSNTTICNKALLYY